MIYKIGVWLGENDVFGSYGRSPEAVEKNVGLRAVSHDGPASPVAPLLEKVFSEKIKLRSNEPCIFSGKTILNSRYILHVVMALTPNSLWRKVSLRSTFSYSPPFVVVFQRRRSRLLRGLVRVRVAAYPNGVKWESLGLPFMFR